MNFYTIRIILIILIYFGLSILYQRIPKDKERKNKLFKRILIICIILVFAIKPEKLFLKFKSIESAFKYSFPTKKILFTELDEDYGFAIYQNNKAKDIIYFEKNDNKFKFSSIVTMYKYKYIGSTIITVKNIKNTKNYFIYVDYKNTDRKSIEVYDSMDNKYIECKVDNKYNYYYFIKDKPDNYYIMIDHRIVYV